MTMKETDSNYQLELFQKKEKNNGNNNVRVTEATKIGVQLFRNSS